MARIKKMVMHGFKSFAKKTEILFDPGINVVIGPNGSGKSNISDALCFVLGRLSIKSMRAAKAGNLIFMGSKYVKPAQEASVELIFDNSGRTFNLPNEEINLKRIVRRSGQSVYKINGETKTRGEIIELLAHAGIDPHGFNIVLQGQIGSLIKMRPDDRRKIIEEVAGIAVYESRKEKSLKELEKTEDRLKTISTVLRERSAYLKNLEKEKAEAERHKKLEEIVKGSKAGIIHSKITMKRKEIDSLIKSIEEKMNLREKIKKKGKDIQEKITSLSEKISDINKKIQEATGVEQEKLHNEIANLKGEIEGLRVRKENYERRKEEIEKRVEEIEKGMPEINREIAELKRESPLMAKKAEEVKKKKQELAELEKERKMVLGAKSEMNSLQERIKEKEIQIGRVKEQSDELVKQLDSYYQNLTYKNKEECMEKLEHLKHSIGEDKGRVRELEEKELENEKTVVVAETDIKRAELVKKDVSGIDICPLCQSKMDDAHKEHVFQDCDVRIERGRNKLEKSNADLNRIREEKKKLHEEIKEIGEKISKGEIELERHGIIKDRKIHLKNKVEEEKTLKEEIEGLEKRIDNLELKIGDLRKIEEKYEKKMMEIEEISLMSEENIDTALMYKEREAENMKNIIKRGKEDLDEIEVQVDESSENLEDRESELEKRESQEEELNKRFKEMFKKRDEMQKEIQENNLLSNETQGEIRQVEEQVNYLKIGKAKLDAEEEALSMDMKDFEGAPIMKGSINFLEDKLMKAKKSLEIIGSINMRALEVYDEIKKQYDEVYGKVETLGKEKTEILKIIEEIDKKKKKTFMITFKAINELFSENFRKLSNKGNAYLEIESFENNKSNGPDTSKEDIVSGKDELSNSGVNIIVKMAKGKYFDVGSLSGGEQTLVALSLLFAIQEHKPYHFYIFDEIDAALDKRNSERLAVLLQQYMKSGQYIVVTHNDAVILESNLLYGVSMHEGVSKILSLKVEEDSP